MFPKLNILTESFLSPPRATQALAKWLVWLRWGAIGAQLLVLAIVVFWLGLEVSFPTIGGLILFEILSNAGLVLWLRKRDELPESAFALVMGVDVLLLTVLLQATGGPFNPFSLMYLVHIVLAAVTLSQKWVWALTALCLGSYGVLFNPLLWDPNAHHMHHGAALTLHLEGMWWALAVTATLIVIFAASLRSVVVEQDIELRKARENKERESRLASLATLAAGAAHELATPLSTIAVVARELERSLQNERPELSDDARLVNQEVGRCRLVLEQLSLDAGSMMGEAPRAFGIAELMQKSLDGLKGAERIHVTQAKNLEMCAIHGPISGLSQVVRGIFRNALQAGPEPVQVTVERDEKGIHMRVTDSGAGMSADVISRVFEPFFTTRDHGEGMGLGLFLAHRLLNDLGGEIHLESEIGKGTQVDIWIPCEAAHV